MLTFALAVFLLIIKRGSGIYPRQAWALPIERLLAAAAAGPQLATRALFASVRHASRRAWDALGVSAVTDVVRS